jgi:hypothetical protein
MKVRLSPSRSVSRTAVPVAGREQDEPQAARAVSGEWNWHVLFDSLLAFVLVFLVQLLFVTHYGVNAPFWDEWTGVMPLLRDLTTGTLGWQQLFAQHNEHRILIARIVFIGITRLLGETNVLAFMASSALLAAVSSAIWVMTLRRLEFPRPVVLASCLILVSAVQFENMLWGFQVQFYVLVLGALTSITAIALRPNVTWTTIALVCIGCLISTFGIASGLLTWGTSGLCLLLAAWLQHRSPRALLRDRGLLVRFGIFGAAGLGVGLLYFNGYAAPGHNASYAAKNLTQLLSWAAAALSFPLLEDSSPLHVVLAVAQWVVIGAGLVTYAMQRKDARARKKLLLVTGLVAFLLASALVMAYGRGSVAQIPSRYATIFLWGAALALVVAADLMVQVRARHGWATVVTMCLVGLTTAGLLTMQLQRSIDSLRAMEHDSVIRVETARSVVEYLRDQSPQRAVGGIPPFPSAEMLKGFLDDPEITAQLPPWMLAQVDVRRPELAGDAWTAGGLAPSSALRAQPFAWGSWSGAGERTGSLVSPPIRITEPMLAVPLAGYPRASGNQLALEITGGSVPYVYYRGVSPGERWQTWYVDVSAVQGQEVRLVAKDSGDSWFGFAPPYQMSWGAAAFSQLLAAVDMIATLAVSGLLVLWLALIAPARAGGATQARLAALAAALLIGGAAYVTSKADALRTVAFTGSETYIDVLTVLPAELVETPALKVQSQGLFMHPDATLDIGPVRAGEAACFTTQATMSTDAPPDPAADGVEFVVQIMVSQRVVAERAVVVPPRASTWVSVEVPAGQPFVVRLQTRHRVNSSYDWALWARPEIRSCE